MRFQLVPKSMTLDDLERPKRILMEKIVLRSTPENLNEDRPIQSISCKM